MAAESRTGYNRFTKGEPYERLGMDIDYRFGHLAFSADPRSRHQTLNLRPAAGCIAPGGGVDFQGHLTHHWPSTRGLSDPRRAIFAFLPSFHSEILPVASIK